MIYKWLLTGAFVGLLVSAGLAALTDQEREAKFAYDLGPDTIDTTNYPPYQKESYEMFMHACSVCHTPARAINSPYVTPAQWSNYIDQMHIRAQKQLLTPEDARRLVDFLSYDAKVRKVKRKKKFDGFQAELQERFAEIQKEKTAPAAK